MVNCVKLGKKVKKVVKVLIKLFNN